MTALTKNQIAIAIALSATAGSVLGGQTAPELIIPEPPQSDWEFRIEPYLWAPALNGSVGIGPLVTDLDSSASDVLGNLKMAAALQMEARYGRWGLIMDGFYAKLGSDASTPGPIYDTVDGNLKQYIAELSVAYRVFETPNGFVDLYAGMRYNNLSLDLGMSINQPGVGAVSDHLSERIVGEISDSAGEAVKSRLEEFRAANADRREQIADEIKAEIKSNARDRVKQSLVRKIKRVRADEEFDLKDVAISKIARRVKAQRLELARAAADLAAAHIRAAVDDALAGKVIDAEARVAAAEEDLSNAINTELQGRLPTSASADQEWVDPLVGVRAQWNINDKWYLAGRSDIGGFGVGSDLTWSVQGTVGYVFNETVSAELGYRYYDTDYSDGDFSYDMAEHGLFLGVNFSF